MQIQPHLNLPRVVSTVPPPSSTAPGPTDQVVLQGLQLPGSERPEKSPSLLETHAGSVAQAQGSGNRYWLDGRQIEGFSLAELRQASFLTMELDNARAEDALLAAGAAMALGKPGAYVVSDRKQLPWFLQEADQAFPGLVAIVNDKAEVGKALQSLKAGPLPDSALIQQPLDSFIGCLMSKLTPEQYAEGRTHLEAIRDSMVNYRGHNAPYCEGILVKSTSSFDTPRHALQVDLEALGKARECVFYLYDGNSRPSGMWVELGAALAWEKPSVVLTPSLEALPPCLRGEKRPANLRVVVYDGHQQMLQSLADPRLSQALLKP